MLIYPISCINFQRKATKRKSKISDRLQNYAVTKKVNDDGTISKAKRSEFVAKNNIMYKQKSLRKLSKEIEKALRKADDEFALVNDSDTQSYMEAIILGKFDIEKFITAGAESLVFELKDGNILKLSPYKYEKSLEGITPVEIARGQIKTSFDSIYYVVQNKVDIGGLSHKDVSQLRKKVEQNHYILFDCQYDGRIKQSNVGSYINKDGERVPCIVDLGSLKPAAVRKLYKNLIALEGQQNLKQEDFGECLYSAVYDRVTADVDNVSSVKDAIVETNKTIDDFLDLANTLDYTPLKAMRETLQKYDLEPLPEFD